MSLERYLNIRRAQGISENTLRNERISHQYLHQFTGKSELQITKADILQFAEFVNGTSWSSNTKHIRLKALRPFYQEAITQEWMLVDPVKDLKLPKREKDTPQILTVKQMKELLSKPDLTSVKGIRDRTIMELFYSSGLRQAELLNVTRQQLGEHFTSIRLIGKGNKEAVIPVTRMAAYFLSFYVNTIWPRLNKREGEYLFINLNDGGQLTRQSLARIIKHYAKQIGVQNIRCHTFRFSIASHLHDFGADIRHIQEFMRHESINTTSDYIAQGIVKLQEVHRRSHPRGRAC